MTTTLITGVSRRMGLGFETARQLAQLGHAVIVTARQLAAAEALAAELAAEGLTVTALALDVTDDASIAAAVAAVTATHGRLDVLINNAAGTFDYDVETLTVTREAMLAAFDTHVAGPWRLVEAFLPLLERAPAGRIVNVSSEAASFGAGYGLAARGRTLGAYAVTKTALNALTVKLAAALAETSIRVSSVCPGWVATYPGTAEMGARPVPEGAASVVHAATLPQDAPSGRFWRDGAPLAW